MRCCCLKIREYSDPSQGWHINIGNALPAAAGVAGAGRGGAVCNDIVGTLFSIS